MKAIFVVVVFFVFFFCFLKSFFFFGMGVYLRCVGCVCVCPTNVPAQCSSTDALSN